MAAVPSTFSGATAKRLRLEQGRTRPDVADAAQCTVDHIKAIEYGFTLPSVRCLERLAAALGVNVGDLFESEQVAV
jgi:transcriptional regulator with XRE-family HTH domain